jgi:hypothetical protein
MQKSCVVYRKILWTLAYVRRGWWVSALARVFALSGGCGYGRWLLAVVVGSSELAREGKKGREERQREGMCVRVCVCVRERERDI